jgi:putative FmdB family regulatory protein
MPTYEYRCENCEHEFEQFQSMSAKPLRKCPECGKLKLRRLIGTGAGVIFKGSGFYETDYRSDSYKKAAEAEKKSGEKSTDKSSDTKKTDTKSESKSDTKSTKTESKKSKTKPGE